MEKVAVEWHLKRWTKVRVIIKPVLALAMAMEVRQGKRVPPHLHHYQDVDNCPNLGQNRKGFWVV